MKKGEAMSPEQKAKISAAQKGRKFSAEHRAKLSVAASRTKNHTGHKHTEEAKEKMRAAVTGKKASAETRAKMSAAHMGNKSNLGRKLTEEQKAKIGAAARGNTYAANPTEETRAKIGESKVGNTYACGENYIAGASYACKTYRDNWGPIPQQDNGRAYSIHHRDGNRQNGDPDNLVALTVSEHMVLERALERGDWDLAAEIDAIGLSRRQVPLEGER